MSVSAIIVNYYTSQFLSPLLRKLEDDSYISEVIVVNNSKKDKLSKTVKPHRKARIIENRQNLGFARAVNQGYQTIKNPWILIINPDTLPDDDCTEQLLKGLEDTNALIAGPRFYWDKEKRFRLPPASGDSWKNQCSFRAAQKSFLDKRLLSFDWIMRHERFWSTKEPFFEPFLSGACLLVRNDKSFLKDGIFDERFFLYYEDTDLCVKALLNEKQIICVPRAEIIHYWNQSPSEEKGSLMGESMHQFFNKYYSQSEISALEGFNKPDVIEDLGILSETPVFNFSRPISENTLLEIGMNPLFIPFAQTNYNLSPFRFPVEIFEKLGRGVYHTRLRDNATNETLKQWSWKKN